MADATTARSDSASRDEELRPATKQASPLVAFATLLGQADALYDEADRQYSPNRNSIPAFRGFHDRAYATLCESQYDCFDLIPAGDDRDLMILAGFASMLADQLDDMAPEDNRHAQRLFKGISTALVTICAELAAKWPAGPESIAPLYPELAKSIRRDMMTTDARRADAEGR